MVKIFLYGNAAFSMRKRIYMTTLFAGIVLTFLAGVLNFILGLNAASYFVPFGSLAVFIAFYFYTHKKAITSVVYRLGLGFLLYVFYPIFCFINGGFNGGFHYFFSFFWILAIAVLPGRNRGMLISFVFIVLATLAVDYYFPTLAVPYESRAIRYVDLAISVLLLMVAIYVALNVVMKAYDKTNVALVAQKKALEEAQEQLNQKNMDLAAINQSKDKFFSIIAHDLKGAFNSMIGFSQLLHTKYDHLSDDQRKSYFELINTNINNTYSFFETLLEWSRAQRGAITLSVSRENVLLLVEDVVGVLALMADKKEIEVKVDVSDSLYFDLDKHIFITVLRNLLNNAIKFTPHHGLVSLGVTLNEDHQLQVAVRDNGIGISEERQRELLQLSSSKSSLGTDGEQGTGLGLLLCRELIDIHQGELNIESEEGQGSVFQFSIPLVEG